MTAARTLVFIPLAALLIALWAGVRAPDRSWGGALSAEHAHREALAKPSALCGVHGCGCPHDEVPSSCCCVPAAAASAEPVEARAPRVAPAAPRTVASIAELKNLPASSLEGFHCTGGKERNASAGAPAGAAAPSRPAPTFALPPVCEWVAQREPGPLYDLRTEPSIPPPRRARELNQS